MGDWLYHLPVVWMAAVIFAATGVVTVGVYKAVMLFAGTRRANALRAMSPAMLTPLAMLFGLIVAFLSVQVWNDAQRADIAVTREASALRRVVLLAAAFPAETEARVRELVRRHIEDAVRKEWPAMARQQATLSTIAGAVSESLSVAMSVRPQTDVQTLAQREMLAALQSAQEARRERIIISRSSINWVKWCVVILLAVLILTTIAIVHIDNRGTAAVAMSIFATGVAACLLLIASHNRPFTGEISVGPHALLQVVPQ